jgi:hypothetical protein
MSRHPDWLAEEPVSSEPVSAAEGLLAQKNSRPRPIRPGAPPAKKAKNKNPKTTPCAGPKKPTHAGPIAVVQKGGASAPLKINPVGVSRRLRRRSGGFGLRRVPGRKRLAATLK